MSRRKQQSEGPALCPSARAEVGAALIGVIGADGRLAYLKSPLSVDQDFIDEVSADGPPEEFMRFANVCVEGRCAQWNAKGGRCGIPERIKPILGDGEGDAPLKPCSIRTACRWFRQDGPSACRICPGVATDTPEA